MSRAKRLHRFLGIDSASFFRTAPRVAFQGRGAGLVTAYQTGKFTVRRKTIGKRMAAKLKEKRVGLRKRLARARTGNHEMAAAGGEGYFQYHAIPGNLVRLRAFRCRGAGSKCYGAEANDIVSWERLTASLEPLLPPVEVLHRYPDARFDSKYTHIRGKNRVR